MAGEAQFVSDFNTKGNGQLTEDFGYVEYQCIVVSGDVTDNSWLNELDSNTNLYASIDESSYNDSDYIYTESYDSCTLALSDPSKIPNVANYHKIVVRAQGNGLDTLRIYLLESTTPITYFDLEKLSPILATYEYELTTSEINAISDYSALNIKFETISI